MQVKYALPEETKLRLHAQAFAFKHNVNPMVVYSFLALGGEIDRPLKNTYL